MFDELTILLLIVIYVGLLFVVSLFVERRGDAGRKWSDNALVYSLSLGIYCTAWTYYGSVGTATTQGMLFLTYYLGPMASIVLWWIILRKLVRIKQEYRITSIADFIAARYNNSQALAAIATILACIAIAPYMALQFKAIHSAFNIITENQGAGTFIKQNLSVLLIILFTVFTIAFGVRRLDPTERHRGMVAAVAVETLVKLLMFLVAGVLITYFMFNGFGDIFSKFLESGMDRSIMSNMNKGDYAITWITYLILSFTSILFLPRQFHIAVIENTDEKHIRTAMWMLPAYLLLINIFVLPIAMAGLLKGLPAAAGDTFVLRLPFEYGKPMIGLMVFMGGFSASMSMIMICAMTLATMISNHIVLPAASGISALGFIRRNVLKVRWAAVLLVIAAGHWFETSIGGAYSLVNIGMIAFSACAQFAPAVLGGIFWRRGNHAGALLGLSSGFAVWFYTLLLPSFIKTGIISSTLLDRGPWGMGFLRPEQLLGVTSLPPLSHALLWCMVFNIGFYVLGSIVYRPGKESERTADSFVDILQTGQRKPPAREGRKKIGLGGKKERLARLLEMYFPKAKAESIVSSIIAGMGLTGRDGITSLELFELCERAEKVLAGSVGATVAHTVFKRERIFDADEIRELNMLFGEILADLKIPPRALHEQIDFYREREKLITEHSNALEDKLMQLQNEIAERVIAEEARHASEARLQAIIDNAPAAIFIKDIDGRFILVNKHLASIYGKMKEDIIGWNSYELLMGEVAEAIRINDRHVLETAKPVFVEEEIRFACGEIRPYASIKFPMFNPDGEIYGIGCISSDITERKRAEKELELYRDHLEELVKERTVELKKAQEQLILSERLAVLGQFSGSIAHEVRNPLSVISNAVYMLKRAYNPDNEKYHTYLEMIGTQVKRVAEIIESVLRLTRMRNTNREETDISAVIMESIELAGIPPQIEKKLLFPSVPALVFVDKEQLRIAFRNIIVNAVQAMGDTGTLAVSIDSCPDEGMDHVAAVFSDTGGGIEEKDLDNIFNPLFSTKTYGIGFGLPIVKMIVEAHNGKIHVDTTPGAGTVFRIMLPRGNGSRDR